MYVIRHFLGGLGVHLYEEVKGFNGFWDTAGGHQNGAVIDAIGYGVMR